MKFSPPENEEIAARLTHRADDTEEAVKVRLQAFHGNLNSIIDKYENIRIGINGRLDRDLYVSLGNMVSDNKWSMRIYDKPLIRLIWIGTIFMILGAIFSIRFKQSKIYE